MISDFSAADFFRSLTGNNRLAALHNFRFAIVSDLEGFAGALSEMQSAHAFVCVSDTADGFIDLNNTPRTRRVKTVFLAMRHKAADMKAREKCLDIMRELFRQFMTILIREKVKLELNSIYLDPRIAFTEIDRYFFSGCACAFFQISTDIFTDLRYNESEWINPTAAT